MRNFLITYGHLHGKGCDTVRAMNYIILRSIVAQIGKGCTYMNLDSFSHTLTHLDIVLTSHVFLNISSQDITCNTQAFVSNNTAKADYCNLCASSTYIHNHVTLGCQYVKPDTDCGSHWLVDQIYFTAAGMLSTVSYSAKLYFGRTARYTNHHSHTG